MEVSFLRSEGRRGLTYAGVDGTHGDSEEGDDVGVAPSDEADQ